MDKPIEGKLICVQCKHEIFDACVPIFSGNTPEYMHVTCQNPLDDMKVVEVVNKSEEKPWLYK